jgi:hypothetical protein
VTNLPANPRQNHRSADSPTQAAIPGRDLTQAEQVPDATTLLNLLKEHRSERGRTDHAGRVGCDDEVVYTDAGYQGAQSLSAKPGLEHLAGVEFRVAIPKSKLAGLPVADRAIASRQAGVRAKVEHPFLVVKRDFGFVKTRYRGLAKNAHHLAMLFASANWLMRARAVALMG